MISSSHIYGIIILSACFSSRRNLFNVSVLKVGFPSLFLFLAACYCVLPPNCSTLVLLISVMANLLCSVFWLQNRETTQHFGLFPFHFLFNLSLLTFFFFLGCIFLFDGFYQFVVTHLLEIFIFSSSKVIPIYVFIKLIQNNISNYLQNFWVLLIIKIILFQLKFIYWSIIPHNPKNLYFFEI